MKTDGDWDSTFYNLQCSASGQTTTVLNVTVFSNILTIGAGVLTGSNGIIGAYSSNANPFVIDSNADMTGLNHFDIWGDSCNLPAHSKYPSIQYDAYNGTLTLLGDVTCGYLTIYSQGTGVGTVDLAGHSLTLRTTHSLTIGQDIDGAALRNSSAAVSTVTVGGYVLINSGNSGTVFNAAKINISVAGNWTNNAGANGFSAGNGTVTFNGTGVQTITSGGAAFNSVAITTASSSGVTFADQLLTANLTDTAAASHLEFAPTPSNAPHTVTGVLTLSGTAGNLLTLRSVLPGTQWYLNPASWSVQYVDVQDSVNQAASAINAANSADSGNNVNWVLSPGSTTVIPPGSIVSPVQVEGQGGTQGTVTVVTATEQHAAQFLDGIRWYGEVDLSPTGTTAVSVKINGNTVASQNVAWTVTDLAGQNSNNNSVTIRQGDSLLLTASGNGTTLTIDANGDSVIDFTGAPGDNFAYQYATAGTYIAQAWIDGNSVGTLTVTVISVNFGSNALANIVGASTPRTVPVTPSTAVNSVWFGAADPSYLTVTYSAGSGAAVLAVTSWDANTPKAVVARVGSAAGRILAFKSTVVFSITFVTNTALPDIIRYPDGDSLVGGCLQMTPYIAGVNLQIHIVASGTLFENGTTYFNFSTNDMDQNAQYDYYMVKGPSGNLCHYVQVVE